MHPEYDKYEKERIALQNEVNASVIKPISFEIFQKTPEERQALRVFKSEWKRYQRAKS